MCVEQQLQSRNTSQSDSSSAGETMSPKISMESFIEPIQAALRCTDDGGMTSAIGFPNRVTRIGFFVLHTCSKSERHFALNCEIATSCIWLTFYTIVEKNDQFWDTSSTHCQDWRVDCARLRRWPGTESNRRRQPFQGCSLPFTSA